MITLTGRLASSHQGLLHLSRDARDLHEAAKLKGKVERLLRIKSQRSWRSPHT